MGDITRGKVEVAITGVIEEGSDEKSVIYLEKVMENEEQGTFNYHGTTYTLTIEDLINQLIGDDSAEISIKKV